MKTLSFVKVRCRCGHLTLIPTYGRLLIPENISCEGCGKTIVEVQAFGQT